LLGNSRWRAHITLAFSHKLLAISYKLEAKIPKCPKNHTFSTLVRVSVYVSTGYPQHRPILVAENAASRRKSRGLYLFSESLPAAEGDG
jgi:hypothetical protein